MTPSCLGGRDNSGGRVVSPLKEKENMLPMIQLDSARAPTFAQTSTRVETRKMFSIS